jgi:hypothetical protein
MEGYQKEAFSQPFNTAQFNRRNLQRNLTLEIQQKFDKRDYQPRTHGRMDLRGVNLELNISEAGYGRVGDLGREERRGSRCR